MTKFKVGDSLEFIEKYGRYEIGDKVTATSYTLDNLIRFEGKNGTGCALESRFKLSDKPSKNQRITKLESEIAELLPLKEEVEELKLIVHQLRKPNVVKHVPVLDGSPLPSTVIEEVSASTVEDTIEYEGQQYQKVDREAREGDVVVFNGSDHPQITDDKPYKIMQNKKEGFFCYVADSGNDYNLDNEFVNGFDVYELLDGYNQIPMIDETVEPVKSPNQLRAEIIEKVKSFIEDSKTTVTGPILNGPGKGEITTFENVYSVHKIGISKTACNAEFVVNEEKRTIVALLRGIDTNKIYHRGIAKCHPNNVFNEHIGKAIALGRALGLDVSEFEQAVQPNEVVVGMKTYHEWSHEIWEISGGNLQFINNQHRITNDTNAIYGGVE